MYLHARRIPSHDIGILSSQCAHELHHLAYTADERTHSNIRENHLHFAILLLDVRANSV